MSLSVISSPLAAIAPPPPGSAATTGTAGTGLDFSALLFSQMGALSSLITDTSSETRKEATREEETENSSDVLALFLGNLQPVPPAPPPDSTSPDSTPHDSPPPDTAPSSVIQPYTAVAHPADAEWEKQADDPGVLMTRNSPPSALLSGEISSGSGSGSGSGSEVDAATANLAAATSFTDLLAQKGENTPLTAGAAAHLQATQAGKTEAPTHHPSIQTPLSQPGWGHEFGEKLVWMAKNDQQSAQININPPQLGPIQIHLSLNGDQATATFASPFGEVRQAIESALPQLKEMLSSSGIDLGQANVGANLAQQQRESQQQQAKTRRDGDENAILPATGDHASSGTIALGATGRGQGKVDLFA